MNSKDIYKINNWIEDSIKDILYPSSIQPFNYNCTNSYVDKIKYYEKIEYFLEKYIIEKLQNSNCMIIPENIDFSYDGLKSLFTEFMNDEEQQQFFERFCFYIMDILSSLQMWAIVWYDETNEKYINNFTLTMKNSKLDELHSHKNSSNLKIFVYLLNVLKLECYKMEGYSRIPSKTINKEEKHD